MADLKTVKKYYNLCDPKESLKPDDARNEDLDVRGPDGTFVRGLRWVDRLARSITLADKPVQCWFTGLPGSGKSTELQRLAGACEPARVAAPADAVARFEHGDGQAALRQRLGRRGAGKAGADDDDVGGVRDHRHLFYVMVVLGTTKSDHDEFQRST